MNPMRLAVTASLLGPALLLRAEPLWWGLLILLLPLNALALTFACRAAPESRCAAILIPLLLILAPLEMALAGYACRVTGLAEALPVTELSLVLIAHTGAFLLLLSRTAHAATRRHLGVQAACRLPLPLAGLALLALLESLLVPALIQLGAAPQLAASGLPRLLAAALVLMLLQRRWEAQGAQDPLGEAGGSS